MNPARKPLRALHGLRFFAAFHILAFHYAAVAEGTVLERIVRRGPSSVSLFFVLSGFVLAYNYLDPAAPVRLSRRGFWWARFARIYPVYLLGLVLGAPAFLRRVVVSDGWTRTAIAHATEIATAVLLLVQAWIPDAACMWNCPGWSLSAEAFFYLLFPWLAAPFARWNSRRVAVATVAWLSVAVALQVSWWLVFRRLHACNDSSNELAWLKIGAYNPVLLVPQFFTGVGVGRLFSQETGNSATSRWAPWIGVLALGGILAILSGRWPYDSQEFIVFNLALTPLYALLVWAMAWGGGGLARLLGTRGLVVLGEASYALYLLHGPIHNFFQLLEPRWAEQVAPRLTFSLFAALSIIASIAVFFWFEEPARKWLRRRVGVGRPATSAVGSPSAG